LTGLGELVGASTPRSARVSDLAALVVGDIYGPPWPKIRRGRRQWRESQVSSANRHLVGTSAVLYETQPIEADGQNGEDVIRTCSEIPMNAALSDKGGAESGALDTPSPALDPALASLIDTWPKLPEAIRTAMLALAEMCRRGEA
jgi:hypothetical protein